MAAVAALTTLAVLLALAADSGCALRQPTHSQHAANVQALLGRAPHRLLASPVHGVAARARRRQPATSPDSGLRVTPAAFGGDPTGVRDSTAALQAAISTCVNQSRLSPNGLFPGSTSFPNHEGIRDAGGCFVDLDGGEYLVSETIAIPEYLANMNLGYGSLVAATGFKGDFIITIGVKDSCKVPQGSCNIDINFPELFVDGRHQASAFEINHVMGVTIGPGGYFLNYTNYGIQINAGHEVMVDRCWMGETNFDFDFAKFGVEPNSTAVEINGNDHYILNSIVFSSKVGIAVHGAADYISGVHVWFPINRALAYNDTRAFSITGGGNRFVGCYIDGNRAVFEGSATTRNIWTEGFECCAGGGLDGVPHGIILASPTIGPGLEIYGNEFNHGNIWYQGGVASPVVKDSRIENNVFQTVGKGTRAQKSLSQQSAKTWEFTFCDVLAMPTISTVKYWVAAETGFPQAVARPPRGCNVTIETSEAVTATITVAVDSSTYSGALV